MSNWTPERRARQAALIRALQPWRRSTGPRTAEGKAKVARNAYRGGERVAVDAAARVLREHLQEIQALQKKLGHRNRKVTLVASNINPTNMDKS
ncbi:hypothetical protein [Rhodoferax sp.]|uniref:hypothetical protein n=1 Tax=Rhodoferax sp. TaxID=50421 RepID=UPI00374D81E2